MNSSRNSAQDKKIVIAIDGFSSGGKSTFARMLAARLGYIFIDTKAMYRAVTLYGIEHGAIRNGVPDRELCSRTGPVRYRYSARFIAR